jgi:hypothetical protein
MCLTLDAARRYLIDGRNNTTRVSFYNVCSRHPVEDVRKDSTKAAQNQMAR